MATPVAHPPETLEGWYALHQIYTCRNGTDVAAAARELSTATSTPKDGWSVSVELVGSRSDLLSIHFRPSLETIGEAQNAVRRCVRDALDLDYRSEEHTSELQS